MGKDQIIGAALFVVCIAIALFYIVTLFLPEWLEIVGLKVAEESIRFWLIAAPVLIAFVAIMCIGAWIGWTMATTPPPKPIEEIARESEGKNEGQGENSQ